MTTFGFIRGEDGVPRFFIPSYLQPPTFFDSLAIGDEVVFDPTDHPQGARARNVLSMRDTAPAVALSDSDEGA